MEKSSSFQIEAEKFEKLLGYGTFRPYKNGIEVRVKDLDASFIQAQQLITKHKLKLTVSDKDVQLRSFVVSPNQCSEGLK